MSVMLMVLVSWAERVWALPFLTVLTPDGRYYQSLGKPHEKLTAWARQMLLQLKRWLIDREVIAIAYSSYAVIDCTSLNRNVARGHDLTEKQRERGHYILRLIARCISFLLVGCGCLQHHALGVVLSSTLALSDTSKSLLEKQELLSGYFYHILLSSRH